MGTVTEFAPKKGQASEVLVDKVAGFTFSRKPRAERIEAILSAALAKLGLKVVPVVEGGSFEGTLDGVELVMLAKEIEPYAFKDFAVRFGKLDDAAPTHRI